MQSTGQLLSAVQIATRKLSGSENLDNVLRDVLAICVEAAGASGGTIYLHDPVKKVLRFQYVLPEEVASKIQFGEISDDQGVSGQVFQSRHTQISDFEKPSDEDDPRARVRKATGVEVHNMITVPLMIEGEPPIGVVQLVNKPSGFNSEDVDVLDTISAVSTLAYLNRRLMDDSARASTLLGMGKVGHDIGNLAASLFANLSFSEMALQGMAEHFAQTEADETAKSYLDSLLIMLDELRKSVDRIVGYSRLISDLSAGRELRPNKKVGRMSETVQHSAAYLETEGRRNHVALRYEIDTESPEVDHDELYIFRIVQNLVGNAIKAVKETIPVDWQDQLTDEDAIMGEVRIVYRFDSGEHILEVFDTGPGMTRDIAEKILAGNVRSQWEKGSGSGWGTKIVLELAATHNAKVEIDSELGKGSVFRLRFPS